MAKFSYKATDKSGQQKAGVVDASNESAVIQNLRDQNLIPITISQLKVKSADGESKFKYGGFLKRIRHRDVMDFTGKLSTLLESGITLDRSLAISADLTENPRLKEIIREVRRKVQGGASFADALAQHPKVFSRLYVNMVKSGEAGGVLEMIVQRISGFLETANELRQEITNASIYPIVLSVVAAVVIIVMVTFVLPKFSIIFASMGADLPLITRVLVRIVEFFKNSWFFIFAGFLILIFGLKQYFQTKDGKMKLDRMKLNLPYLGDLVAKVEIARFSRTLGTLVRSGVPILQAISIVKETISNDVISSSLLSVYSRLKEGGGLSTPLKETGCFPPLAVHMIAVGEETGSIESMLLKVADTYENDVRITIKRVMALLEPAIILIFGVIIAFVVIAMLMAVFSVSDLPV